MGVTEIEESLTNLAVERNVSASTQNQAFNALLFLYRNVLNISLEGEKINAVLAQKKRNLPVWATARQDLTPFTRKVLGASVSLPPFIQYWFYFFVMPRSFLKIPRGLR